MLFHLKLKKNLHFPTTAVLDNCSNVKRRAPLYYSKSGISPFSLIQMLAQHNAVDFNGPAPKSVPKSSHQFFRFEAEVSVVTRSPVLWTIPIPKQLFGMLNEKLPEVEWLCPLLCFPCSCIFTTLLLFKPVSLLSVCTSVKEQNHCIIWLTPVSPLPQEVILAPCLLRTWIRSTPLTLVCSSKLKVRFLLFLQVICSLFSKTLGFCS